MVIKNKNEFAELILEFCLIDYWQNLKSMKSWLVHWNELECSNPINIKIISIFKRDYIDFSILG